MVLSFTVLSSDLSTSEASVSSRSTLGPLISGPNAQTLRAARRSQSYFSWKKPPIFFLLQAMSTSPSSMSSARPLSSGSAIMVSLLCLFGVSAKHLRDEVSMTVSRKLTTGSATLTSIFEYISRRSCMMQSSASSPVVHTTCSPDSSTLVLLSGYDLLMRRRPSTILGSSLGRRGSTASFTTAVSLNFSGLKIVASAPSAPRPASVAVLLMVASTPWSITQLPAPSWSTSML
mmetsp:Transcript_37638/g.117693  ORF Transcript_37638/g.117693 Transcript_37638/m.117693 type:complete len:232 (-) Transcript_37638:1562-2257(-)